MSCSLSRLRGRVAGAIALASTLVALNGCRRRPLAIDNPSRTGGRAGSPDWERDARLLRAFPGVALVSTREGGFLVRILSGLTGDGAPLYVIDGAPMVIDERRGIDWFTPEDIVQLKALKDPSETAVYGTRGANGVIVIFTKQGARPR